MLKLRTIFQTWLVFFPRELQKNMVRIDYLLNLKQISFGQANNIDKNLPRSVVLDVFYTKSKSCHLFSPEEPYVAELRSF
jgi:hypothetical protein